MKVGGTLDSMANLGTTFRTNAGRAVDIRTAIDSAMRSTDWTGPAADRFRDYWQQFAPELNRLHDMLTEAGNEVDRRRDALDAATR